jgi:uncharacterized protein YggE
MKRLPFLSTVMALALTVLFAAPSIALAQPVTTSLPGITASGMGTASAPAETAFVVISVGSDSYLYAEGSAMDQPGIEPTVPIVTAEEIAAPIVDALVTAGLSVAEIEINSNTYGGGYGPYGGPQIVFISFELADPTVEGIIELLDPAIAAATSARLFVNMTSVVYGVADCAPLQREAREAAIEDARANAELQADLLDVSLGDVVASREYAFGAYAPYYGPVPVNTCSSEGVDPKYIGMYGGPAFDPMLPTEVVVQSSVELTFEILPGSTATPAS